MAISFSSAIDINGSMTGAFPEDIDSSNDKQQQQQQNLHEIDAFDPQLIHDLDLPVHKAAYKGDNTQLTSLLLSGGVDVDTRSTFGYTPLHLAIHRDQGEAVRILLSAGADPASLIELEPAYMLRLDAINSAAWLGAQHALAAMIDFGVRTPSSALCRAASLNRVECMRTILDRLGDGDFSDVPREGGLGSALDRASLCWHVEAVDLVLEQFKKITANSVRENQSCLSSALVNAAQQYDCDDRCRKDRALQLLVMQNLIAAGADVNWEDPGLKTSAFWASLDGPLVPTTIVRLLLENGLQLDKPSSDGSTPLFGIIVNYHDDAGLVEAFLNQGANASATDANLNTPLHSAAQCSFVELLLKHGADPFARNLNGELPFHLACEDWRMDVVESLLRIGSNVNEPSTARQWTPLMFATKPHRIDMCNPFSERHEQVVDLLLARGANVRATASDGRTALHNAARRGSNDLVMLMIQHGADIRAVTSDGETPLHSVCEFRNFYRPRIAQRLIIIQTLLDHGADIAARDESGSTPLHAARPRGEDHRGHLSPDLFNLLLKKGADRHAVDKNSRTPVNYIDTTKWIWNEEGLVCEKPKPVYKTINNVTRGNRGGRGGRGAVGTYWTRGNV